jgi:hypothetical protein
MQRESWEKRREQNGARGVRGRYGEMILQRFTTVTCPGAHYDRRFDLLDVYELRHWPDGPPVLYEDAVCFEAILGRPGYLAARARLTAPLVSFVAGAAPGDGASRLALWLSALRSSREAAAEDESGQDVMLL